MYRYFPFLTRRDVCSTLLIVPMNNSLNVNAEALPGSSPIGLFSGEEKAGRREQFNYMQRENILECREKPQKIHGGHKVNVKFRK